MLELLRDAYLRRIFPNVVTPLDFFPRSTQFKTLEFALFLIHLSLNITITRNPAVEGEVRGLK